MLGPILRAFLQLLEPVGLVWCGLILLSLLLWRRRQRLPFFIAASLAGFVTVVGGTGIPAWMLWRLEKPWISFRIADAPKCDAIVILGGGAEPSRYEAGGVRMTRAGDRILTGLELLRLGCAPVMLVGGGFVRVDGVLKIESELVVGRIQAWQPSGEWEILSLGAATDTHDEALRLIPIAKQRGWKRILLVTSACHMRRALDTYRAAGFDAVPAPCNFLVAGSATKAGLEPGMPGSGGLERLGIWMHEVIGYEVYRLRGWLDASGEK